MGKFSLLIRYDEIKPLENFQEPSQLMAGKCNILKCFTALLKELGSPLVGKRCRRAIVWEKFIIMGARDLKVIESSPQQRNTSTKQKAHKQK